MQSDSVGSFPYRGGYSVVVPGEMERLRYDLIELYASLVTANAAQDDEGGDSIFTIPEHPRLLGLPHRLYEQIGFLLRTKRHLLFYGPPGTGKTSLAEHVASHLHEGYQVVTASSDWSSQDVIGGYQPVGNTLRFTPGLLLEHFDEPIVVDELNRTDIDKALGPLFTVLSGHSTTLPYLVDINDPTQGRYKIHADMSGEVSDASYTPGPNWRLLATINTLDKASLYQMSYALSRRFGWVLVDVPADLQGFVREYLSREGIEDIDEDDSPPLAVAWDAVNQVRPMGPAPFIDIINYCVAAAQERSFFGVPGGTMQAVYVEGLTSFVIPMLDGITTADREIIQEGIIGAFALDEGSEPARALTQALNEVTL